MPASRTLRIKLRKLREVTNPLYFSPVFDILELFRAKGKLQTSHLANGVLDHFGILIHALLSSNGGYL